MVIIIFFILFRSRKDTITRRGHQISYILANLEHCVDGRRHKGFVPRPWHSADPADSKYRYHNGNI